MTYPHRLPVDSEHPLLTLTFEPQDALWTIELHNGEDNRLTHKLIQGALKPALDIVERDWRTRRRDARAAKDADPRASEGALIIVGRRSQDKFFSNGLDYASASADPNFFPVIFNPLLVRLLTFPIPTVAAINGHAFAGGLMLAFACDYRVMVDGMARRAWACMNEVDFGAPWPQSLAALANAKVRDPRVLRRLALEGARFAPPEALAAGLVDALADGGTTAAVLSRAHVLAAGVRAKAAGGVWGLIKRELYRETLELCARDYRAVMPDADDAAARARL